MIGRSYNFESWGKFFFSRSGDGEQIVHQALQVNSWSPVTDESRVYLFSSVTEVVEHDAFVLFEFEWQDKKKYKNGENSAISDCFLCTCRNWYKIWQKFLLPEFKELNCASIQ